MSANYIPQKTLYDYKLEKIDILEEMRIYLKTDEIKHLMSLGSEIAVDQYAHSLIVNRL
jgi:hypothetical protein